MDIFIRTRGTPRELDYQFIGGEAPADFWWRAYKQVTDIERPTILLRSDGTAWQAYIAGIRSRRLDVTENVIQFNLVLAGECDARTGNGTGSAGNELALAVIGRSAADLASHGGQFIAGDLLDRQLPDDEVERLLRTPGEESAAAAANAVRAGYRPLAEALPAPVPRDGAVASPGGAPDAGPPLPFRAWLGGLAEQGAVDAFTALAGDLLRGSRGRAVVLNLIADEMDEAELPAWDGTLGVLAARPDANLEMAVRALGKAGSPPREETSQAKPRQAAGSHRKRTPAWRQWSSRTRVALIAAAVTLVAAAIVAGWLVANPPG